MLDVKTGPDGTRVPLHEPAEVHPARQRGMRFRPDIEGLRGLAILLVLGYHAGVPGLGGGYVGVDVFFVLSGFLITGLLVDEIETTGKLDLVQFYARRARRLLPAALVVVLATILLGRILLSPIEQRVFANTALATTLYISNFWFIRQATDYLAADAETNPLLHTWSLAVEEQFYLFWPLLLFVVLIGMRGRSPRVGLTIAMLVMLVVSFAAGLWLLGIAQPWAFFSSASRAWEFAFGGLAFLFAARRGSARGLNQVAGWAGLLAIGAAGITFSRTTPFPGVAAILPVAGTALLLVAGTRNESSGAPGLLTFRGMQWFGRLSYSWYLWHWPVLVFAAAVLHEPALPLRVAAVVAALGLAMITHRYLENPVRHNRALASRPWMTLALAASLTICGAGISRLWRIAATSGAETPTQQRFTRASKQLPHAYDNGCHAAYLQRNAPSCVFGDSTSETTVVLFGDSHAAQWLPALRLLAQEHHLKIVSLTKSACPYPDIRMVNEQLGREYIECSEWRAGMLKRIVAMQPDVVLLSSMDDYVSTDPDSHQASLQAWANETREVVETLTDAGSQVALIRDTPEPGFDVPICLARADWVAWEDASDCTFTRESPFSDAVHHVDEKIALEFEGVFALDLTDEICPAAACDVQRAGRVIYRDSHHLSVEFSAALASALESALLPILTAADAAFPRDSHH